MHSVNRNKTVLHCVLPKRIEKLQGRALFIQISIIYCPLLWHFCSAKSTHNVEKIQEHVLRFSYNDRVSSYNDLVLKFQRCAMHVCRLMSLSLEIFKCLNDLNPPFMKEIFLIRTSKYSSLNPNNLTHYRANQATFGTNRLKPLGPHFIHSFIHSFISFHFILYSSNTVTPSAKATFQGAVTKTKNLKFTSKIYQKNQTK